MRQGRFGAAAVGALSIGLALTVVSPASALPSQGARVGTDLSCFTGDENASLDFSASFDSTGGFEGGGGSAFAGDAYAWAYETQGTLEDGAFTVTLSFLDETETPAGTLMVAGTTEVLGDPTALDERYRDGNAWYSVQGTVQQLLVTGEVESGTGLLEQFVGSDLMCGGADVDVRYGGTNPATRISRWSQTSAFCALGENGYLGLDMFGDESYATVVLGIDPEDPESAPDLVTQGSLSATESSITGSLVVIDPWTGQPTSAPAALVGVDLRIGARIANGVQRWKWRQGAFHERFTTYALTGTLTLPDASVVEVTDCELRKSTTMDRYSSRAGQKPGGRAPANDLPGGALALAAGATARTSTRGAAEAPEASCTVAFGDDEWEVPLGRTVWYSLTGTGGDVTLSTVGSDFDTVIGVYEADSLEPVACVDDTEETGLQARLTVPTTAGTDYLVQVGGFGADWGKVVLARS